MSRGAPSLTGEAMIERTARLSRRLSKHLSAWLEGDEDAVEDVAGLTRTLLARGQGDDSILRLCNQNRLALPLVRVGVETSEDAKVEFSFGSLPVDDMNDPGESGGVPLRMLDLRDWTNSAFMISAQMRRRRTTWNNLITDYGNTYGAHLSSTVPAELTLIELFGGPSGNLGHHALRSAAIVAEQALAEVLPQVGQAESASPRRPFSPTDTVLTALSIHPEANGLSTMITAKIPDETLEPAVLLRMPFNGQYLEIAMAAHGPDSLRVGMRIQ